MSNKNSHILPRFMAPTLASVEGRWEAEKARHPNKREVFAVLWCLTYKASGRKAKKAVKHVRKSAATLLVSAPVEASAPESLADAKDACSSKLLLETALEKSFNVNTFMSPTSPIETIQYLFRRFH